HLVIGAGGVVDLLALAVDEVEVRGADRAAVGVAGHHGHLEVHHLPVGVVGGLVVLGGVVAHGRDDGELIPRLLVRELGPDLDLGGLGRSLGGGVLGGGVLLLIRGVGGGVLFLAGGFLLLG